MIANILIAASFFTIGFFAGGVFVLKASWKRIEEAKKEAESKDPLIVRIYEKKG